MKVAVGSDHRGFHVKAKVIGLLRELGHEVTDAGAHSDGVPVDYPDFAFEVATAVGKGEAERGILIDATAIGMTIAANKVSGVRAAPCHDALTAEMSRSHNDANVLCLSADLVGEELIDHMVRKWIDTPFEGGRHQRRVEKITRYESNVK
jgi:ribose 5-phosphate isomerase B